MRRMTNPDLPLLTDSSPDDAREWGNCAAPVVLESGSEGPAHVHAEGDAHSEAIYDDAWGYDDGSELPGGDA
jgi:hypothetical protein